MQVPILEKPMHSKIVTKVRELVNDAIAMSTPLPKGNKNLVTFLRIIDSVEPPFFGTKEVTEDIILVMDTKDAQSDILRFMHNVQFLIKQYDKSTFKYTYSAADSTYQGTSCKEIVNDYISSHIPILEINEDIGDMLEKKPYNGDNALGLVLGIIKIGLTHSMIEIFLRI